MKTLLVMAATLAGVAAVAHADAFECKSTETQAECHDRLKCKANEELEDCQKRLREAAKSQQNPSNGRDGGRDNSNSNNNNNSSRSGGDRGGGDRGGQRDREDGGGNDRDDRGGDRGGGGGEDRGSSRRSGGGRRGGGRGGRSSFTANKTFGLGLELGEPTGLNGKYFASPAGAIDFGLGYVYDHYYYGDGLHLYADYLFHFGLASTDSFELPFYIGPGLRYWQFDYCVQNLCDYRGSAVGIRMPIGIAFDFNNAPIDIFLQLVPTLDFLGGDYYDRYRDRAHFGVDGSVGIRFWFK